MIKRIIAAGCRDYEDYDDVKEYMEICIKRIRKNTPLYSYQAVAELRICWAKNMKMKTDLV